MYCKRCGSPLGPDSRFCPRCGAPVQPGVPGRQPPAPPENAPAGRRSSRRGGSAILIGMVVMVLLLLAAAVWSQRATFGPLLDGSTPLAYPRPGQGGIEKAAWVQEAPPLCGDWPCTEVRSPAA